MALGKRVCRSSKAKLKYSRGKKRGVEEGGGGRGVWLPLNLHSR